MSDVEQPKALGRVEHFLPRFFLNGFAADGTSKEPQVFRFTPGRPAHRVSTKKIGGERDFYGVARGIDLEAQLGREENRYAPLLQRLRQGHQEPEDNLLIAEFVNGLAIRGKYYRTTFANAVQRMLESMQRSFAEPDVVAALRDRLQRELPNRPEIQALPPAQQMVALAALPHFIRTLNVGAMTRQFMGMVREQFDTATVMKNAHADALARAFQERVGAGAMASLTWRVRFCEQGLILGDVGPVVHLKDKPGVHIVHKDITATKTVTLPISSHVVLIGTAPGVSGPEIEPESLNQQTAEICHEFFISATNGAREAEYALALRTRPDPFDDLNFEDMARQSAFDVSNETTA